MKRMRLCNVCARTASRRMYCLNLLVIQNKAHATDTSDFFFLINRSMYIMYTIICDPRHRTSSKYRYAMAQNGRGSCAIVENKY